MKINSFKELEIWKKAVNIAENIYKLTNSDKFSKDYGLKDQLRRSVVSISSNIVEGFERNSNGDFIRFLSIAKGSLGEARSQIYIAMKVQYINESEYDLLDKELADLSFQIGKFISYLKDYKNKLVTRNK